MASLKVLLVAAVVTFVNGGFLGPVPSTLRLSVSAPSPVVSLVSPAVTRAEYTPGSYSSSYRSDVITPRVRYTETPGVSITVPQPSIAIAPAVTRVEHIAPALPVVERIAIPTVARVEPAISLPTVTRLVPETRTIATLPSIPKVEHIASAPLIADRVTPAITRVEHLATAPLITEKISPAITRVEHLAASPLLTERIVPALPAITRVGQLAAPAVAKTVAVEAATPILRSQFGLAAPSTFTYGIDGLATRAFVLEPKIHY